MLRNTLPTRIWPAMFRLQRWHGRASYRRCDTGVTDIRIANPAQLSFETLVCRFETSIAANSVNGYSSVSQGASVSEALCDCEPIATRDAQPPKNSTATATTPSEIHSRFHFASAVAARGPSTARHPRNAGAALPRGADTSPVVVCLTLQHPSEERG